jgi:hypothetical protein
MARPYIPKGARPRQRQGIIEMSGALDKAFSATHEGDCELALGLLVEAAQFFGRGDRQVQPVAPDKQPFVLKEWGRLRNEFSAVERKLIARCAVKRSP